MPHRHDCGSLVSLWPLPHATSTRRRQPLTSRGAPSSLVAPRQLRYQTVQQRRLMYNTPLAATCSSTLQPVRPTSQHRSTLVHRPCTSNPPPSGFRYDGCGCGTTRPKRFPQPPSCSFPRQAGRCVHCRLVQSRCLRAAVYTSEKQPCSELVHVGGVEAQVLEQPHHRALHGRGSSRRTLPVRATVQSQACVTPPSASPTASRLPCPAPQPQLVTLS